MARRTYENLDKVPVHIGNLYEQDGLSQLGGGEGYLKEQMTGLIKKIADYCGRPIVGLDSDIPLVKPADVEKVFKRHSFTNAFVAEFSGPGSISERLVEEYRLDGFVVVYICFYTGGGQQSGTSYRADGELATSQSQSHRPDLKVAREFLKWKDYKKERMTAADRRGLSLEDGVESMVPPGVDPKKTSYSRQPDPGPKSRFLGRGKK